MRLKCLIVGHDDKEIDRKRTGRWTLAGMITPRHEFAGLYECRRCGRRKWQDGMYSHLEEKLRPDLFPYDKQGFPVDSEGNRLPRSPAIGSG